LLHRALGPRQKAAPKHSREAELREPAGFATGDAPSDRSPVNLIPSTCRPADQLVVDATTDADAKLRKAGFPTGAKAARDEAYAVASDARAEMVAEAEQQHRDPLAAIQRHFGQQVTSHGDPDADHALAFVETVADPERLYTPQPGEAASNGVRGIGRVVEIAYTGIKRQVRVDTNGRVTGYAERQEGDGWSTRGTFAGDAEAFIAAKRAGIAPAQKPDPEEEPPPP